ncbi:4-alpha-glucanotransferase [Fournierella sp.]|uniref:4-alpha-glucanotransferase n=1 Tax=Allofournierella sp. TaxID=1940256 RepID=UPI0025C42B63|nr:4-alpha-glucanotransferase [Fournierella sp.]
MLKRASGILLPVSSLPGPWGIGTLGEEARRFVDFLAAAGQTYWQILPVGPTGYGDSPYQSFSAFAANPYFIDPGILIWQGLLTEAEAEADWGEDPARVDYGALYASRHTLLQKAADRLPDDDEDFAAWQQEQSAWLEDYALFMALKEENDQQSWYHWPDEVRLRRPDALAKARQRLAGRVDYWRKIQYLFYRQWDELLAYAHQKGVQIIGDIPIYVSPDSSDIWAAPELFQTDGDRRLTRVAGCPPDAFAADGQLWGNPLYDWPYHKATGYAWWLRRLRHALTIYDVVRIDHFRGFESYYSIPAQDTTAQNGSWQPGPGMDFIGAIHAAMPGAQIIAEDLGYLTPQVKELLEGSGYPGMKVLQFAFDRREAGDYLPHNYLQNSVVYTGTHDNTTTAAWETEAHPEDVARARAYLHAVDEPLVESFIRAALASVSNTAIVPMQDWLGLGGEARMNVPSRPWGNWQWRVGQSALTPQLAGRIAALTELYGR